MFLPDGSGSPVGTVDGMQYVWTGAYPANQCPRIKAGKLKVGRQDSFNNGMDRNFRPGRKLLCIVDADDPNNDSIAITWDLRIDVSNNTATGGAYEPPSVPLAGAVISSSRDSAIIQLPADTNLYRIFCYVKDPKLSAATINVPIVVSNNAPEPVTFSVSAPSGIRQAGLAVAGATDAAFISVDLDQQAYLKLRIYSAKGELVKTIDKGLRGAGRHSYIWKTANAAKGLFYVSLSTSDRTIVKKVIIR
jgi:hypothetical protein